MRARLAYLHPPKLKPLRQELPSVGADERLPHLRDQILLPRTIAIKRIRREREPVIDVH